jgi:Ras-related protein Rab-1A
MTYEDHYDHIFKVIIVGETGVGKSSLLLRACEDVFHSSYLSTIGVDFKIKTIEVEGKIIKIQIWDTAGQERFRTITHSYYRGVECAIMVIDLTDQFSLEEADRVYEDLIRLGNSNMKIFLVGNKSDLINKIKLTNDDICGFMKSKKIAKYIETSAKDDRNIDVLFCEISMELMKNIPINEQKIYFELDQSLNNHKKRNNFWNFLKLKCW